LKVGIIGYAGCGKTTVFNALTGQSVEVGGYSARGGINLGTIKVPDERVDRLSEIFRPGKIVYAEILFADLVAPSPEVSGQAFEPESLGQMRQMDALTHVVRNFDNPAAIQDIDPLRDLRNLEAELALADLAILEKRIERLEKEGGKARELPLLRRLVAHLESERPLRVMESLGNAERTMIKGFSFLSLKPLLVVLNRPEERIGRPPPDDLAAAAAASGAPVFTLCGKVEAELNELEPEDRAAFLADLGLAEPARLRFIRAAYDALDLISFLTVGVDEVRAWSVQRDTAAQRAAGVIHSDMERGFIRSEVIRFEDLSKLGSEARCREAGKMRVEGKEYRVQDGDVVHVRFNV